MSDIERIRGLAHRWAAEANGDGLVPDPASDQGWSPCAFLGDSERAELFAWVRKRCDAADRAKVTMLGTRELRGPFRRGEIVEFTVVERGTACSVDELADVVAFSLDITADDASRLILAAEALSGDGEADAIARVFGDPTGGRR